MHPPETDANSPEAGELAHLRRKVRHLEHAERVQRALFEIADLAGSQLDMDEMLRRLHAIVGELMSAENLYIALHDAERDRISFLYFVDVATPPPRLGTAIPLAALEHSLTWHVIRHGKPLRGSIAAIAEQVPGPLKALGVDAQDWLGVPMLDGTDVRGVLVVQSYRQSDLYTAADQALLGFVASHVLTALQRRQARDELETAVARRTAELATTNAELVREVHEREQGERLQRSLYQIAELAGSAASMDDFYRAVHAEVGNLLVADNFFIALVSDDGRMLHFPYYVNERDLPSPSRKLGDGLTEYVLKSEAPVLLDHAAITRLQLEGAFRVRGHFPRFWLGVPLRCEGHTLGVMTVQSYTEAVAYGPREQDLLQFVSHQIASSLERRRALASLRDANQSLERRVAARTRELEREITVRRSIEEQLKHQVMHDGLTGLPNRAYLLERLDRLVAQFRRDPSRTFTVMFMDIDRFKSINDEIGHHAGDAALREVGKRLAGCVRAPDLVARLAGDEFAALLEDARDPTQAETIAKRLLAALEAPVRIGEHSIVVSSSIGIALASEGSSTAEDLLRNADTAMYRAKGKGRNRCEFFDASKERT